MLPEIDNFRAALAWSFENDPIAGGELAAALCRFFDRLALQEEGLRWIEAALGAERALPELLELDLYDASSTLLINQGRFTHAITVARRAVEIGREFGDARRLVNSFLGLAVSLTAMGNDQELREVADEAAAAAEKLDDELLVSRVNVMVAARESIDHDLRRRILAASIATQKRLRRMRHAGLSMMGWANLELSFGDPETAKDIAQQTVDLCRSIEPTMHVRSLGMLWSAYLRAGDTDRARAAALEQFELAARYHKPLDSRSAVIVFVALQQPIADPAHAARLLGYGGNDSMGPSVGVVAQVLNEQRARAVERVTAELGSMAFAANALEGAAWDEETAYAETMKFLELEAE